MYTYIDLQTSFLTKMKYFLKQLNYVDYIWNLSRLVRKIGKGFFLNNEVNTYLTGITGKANYV